MFRLAGTLQLYRIITEQDEQKKEMEGRSFEKAKCFWFFFFRDK